MKTQIISSLATGGPPVGSEHRMRDSPAERLGHRRVEGLLQRPRVGRWIRPIDDHQQTPIGPQPQTLEIAQPALTRRRVLRGRLPTPPNRCFAPV